MDLDRCIGIKIHIIRGNGSKEFNMDKDRFGTKVNWSRKGILKMGKLKLMSKTIKKWGMMSLIIKEWCMGNLSK